MKSIVADFLFVGGVGFIAAAGFCVAMPLGLCVVGCSMVEVGRRLAKK